MQSDDPLVQRLPAHWESWLTVALGAVCFPLGVYLLVHGILDSSLWFGITGAAVCLASFPLLALSGREVLRRPLLRTSTLVLPRTFHRSRTLALGDISGVGLLYEIGGPRDGWSMRVWTVDGSTYGVDTVRTYARGRKQGRQPAPPPGTPRWHRPRLDWGALAKTGAGRAVTAVDRQVRLVQGPAGPLAESMDQCFAPSYGTYLAFWSPDGQVGWLDGENMP
ncbi:hypothetical protein ACSMXN_24040 [Jatrophihabitans sp. DSM 45814]